MTLLVSAVILLWIAVIGLGVVVVALARQIGVLHERIAPVGALTIGGGPAVGDAAPILMGRPLEGPMITIGGPMTTMKLLLFISADCPVCKKIIPLAKAVARADNLDLILVGDDDDARQRELIARHDLGAYPFVNGPEVGMAFAVGKLPYAVLLDEAGVVAAKGLVNNREHLESLVVSKATGFPSLQSYLNAQPARREPEAV